MAALGGFLFGFDTAVISGTEGTLRQLFAERYASLSEMLGIRSPDFWHGFTVATALIGTVVGAMLVGSIGYVYSLTLTAWAFYTNAGGVVVLAGLLVFIASHAFGQGAVMLVFISEIFPNRVRARGQALGCFTHWFMASFPGPSP